MEEQPPRPTAVVLAETIAHRGYNRVTQQELRNLIKFANRYGGFGPGLAIGSVLGAMMNHVEIGAPVGAAIGTLVSRTVAGLAERRRP